MENMSSVSGDSDTTCGGLQLPSQRGWSKHTIGILAQFVRRLDSQEKVAINAATSAVVKRAACDYTERT